MSWRLQAEITLRDLPRDEKAILRAMANWAHDDGSSCFPSQRRIAWETDYCEKSVGKIQKKLVRRGILVVVEPKRYHHSVVYRIEVKAIPTRPPFRGEENSGLDLRPEKTSGLDLPPQNAEAEVKTGSLGHQDRKFLPQDPNFLPSRPEETSANPSEEPSKETLKENPNARAHAREAGPDDNVVNLYRNSVQEAQAKKELSRYRNEIMRTELYSVDEVSELKTKTLDELKALHAERSKAKVTQKDGISRVIPADRKYESL